jgi:hypothetical protein
MSARLLACLSSILFCLAATSVAEAAKPIAPKLSGTDPVSSLDAPASSTTPSVFGEGEPNGGIVIEAVPWASQLSTVPVSSLVHPTEHPDYEVHIFLGESCLGSPIATGTAGELEEVGITVPVTPDAKTVLSAKQLEPNNSAEESECSNPLPYWEGDIPVEVSTDEPGGTGGGPGGGGSPSAGSSTAVSSSPGSPGSVGSGTPVKPHIHTSPGSISNSTAPVVMGDAQGAESVLVYASTNCGGAPVAGGSAGQLSTGFQVSVPLNAVTSFTAAAVVGQHSACSEAITYTEDSTAPRTRVTMGPGVKTRKRKVSFRFDDVTVDPPGTTYACKVDKKKWRPCTSPLHVKHLRYGRHLVKIRATDLAGNVEPKPVKRRFTVVRKQAL